MIRLWNVYFPWRLFLFIALDATVLFLLAMGATHAAALHLSMPADWASLGLAVLIGAVLLWCMYLFDLYDLDLRSNWHDMFSRGMRALGCAVLLIAPLCYLLAPAKLNYRNLELGLIAFLAMFILYRHTVESMRNVLRRGERLLLVGSGPRMALLSEALQQRLSLPLHVSGVVDDNTHPDASNVQACGRLEDLEKICEKFRPHRIALAMDAYGDALPANRLLELRRRGIRVEDANSLYESLCGRVPVTAVDARSLAYGEGLHPHPVGFAIYRGITLMFTVLLAVLISPLLLLIAIAIKFDSKGPVFYRQERVGLNGRTFRVIKFRSMRTDAEAVSGPVWATDNDPRITRVGRVLRKTRLDELAQIWNVIRGEMCLVGPRPERPHFTEILNSKLPYYDLRHSAPPGITGWAQVCASYGSTVDEARVKLEYDLFYIKNQGPLLDALILFKTVKIALFGRGAR